jgi:hypothetical protein
MSLGCGLRLRRGRFLNCNGGLRSGLGLGCAGGRVMLCWARYRDGHFYAQCGLYFQLHRKEENIYGYIAYLWRKKYGSEMKVRKVPNKYLVDARVFPPRM